MTEFNKSANQATDGGPTLAQVRSWLGSEVAVGVLNVPTDGKDPQVLGFAEVTDRSGLEGALKNEKDVKAAGTHGGFDLFQNTTGSAFVAVSDDTALVANSEAVVNAAVDRLTASSDRLSDSSDYKDTLATLPSDNIVVGYVPGPTLQKLVTLAQTSGPAAARGTVPQAQVDQISAKLAGIRSLGFSLGATDKGLRLRARRSSTALTAACPRRSRRICSSACPPTRGSRPRSATSTRASSRRPTRASRPTRRRRSRSRRSRPYSASSWTISTRCSQATRPSTPGRARRSRRG